MVVLYHSIMQNNDPSTKEMVLLSFRGEARTISINEKTGGRKEANETGRDFR